MSRVLFFAIYSPCLGCVALSPPEAGYRVMFFFLVFESFFFRTDSFHGIYIFKSPEMRKREVTFYFLLLWQFRDYWVITQDTWQLFIDQVLWYLFFYRTEFRFCLDNLYVCP